MKKIFLLLLLLSSMGFAQTNLSLTKKTVAHKFFSTQNKIMFSALAASLAADGYTSQWAFGRGAIEANPVAKPFMKTRGSSSAFFAASFATDMGVMYLAHRKGWHRLEVSGRLWFR